MQIDYKRDLNHTYVILQEEKEPDTKECPYCKSKIAIAATRCPNCTSMIGTADESEK